MVSNPIQRQKSQSLLIGLAIGLAIGLVLCVGLYFFLQSNMTASLTHNGTVKTVSVLNKLKKSGEEINQEDLILKKVSAEAVPTDAISGINLGENQKAVAKIDLAAGTVLANSMLTTEDSKLSDDLREQEYNMVVLPTDLAQGDFVDIRLQLPDGGDYIVVSKKNVVKANANTVWLKMNEEEILVMTNAIVEYYIMTGSKLYATKYTDAGSQKASTPTYVPNSSVAQLISGNANISSLTSGRYTDALKALRNSRINAALRKYDETEQLENLETSLQEEIKNLQESRQAYFGALDSVN